MVVTKPGYGIVSDVIGAGRRLVYTDRGDFPEYPILVREMTRCVPAVHVSNEDLRRGRVAAAVRAVGSACGANPVALVVPCHRAVRTDGGMGGYAWGLQRKRKLLALEKKR